MKVVLKNISDRIVIVGDLSLYPGSERLPLEITPPGEKPYVIQRALIVSDPSRRDIAPKQPVTHGSLLLRNRERGFLFKRPGQYRVNARFDDQPLRLRSNTLVLTVKEAQGVDAKALGEHWGCNPVAEFMMGYTSELVIAREFEAILDKYPTSVYAPWCELALARAQRKRARDDRWTRKQFGAEIFPTRTENAIRDYERFLNRHPDFPFPFPVQMRYEIAKMKLDLGRKQEALREIDELFQKHGEVDFLREATRKIKRYTDKGFEVTSAELP